MAALPALEMVGQPPDVLRRWKDARARKKPFPDDWWIFYELENRETFRWGNPGRFKYLVACFVAGFVAWWAIGSAVLLVLAAISGLLMVPFCLVLPRNVFAREKDRGTAQFLVSSPADGHLFLLEKWFFYLTVGLKIVVPGLLVVIAASFAGPYLEVRSDWRVGYALLAFAGLLGVLPLLTICGIASGLYPIDARWILLIPVALLVLLVGAYGVLLAFILLMFFAYVLLNEPSSVLDEPVWARSVRTILRRCVVGLAILDGVCLVPLLVSLWTPLVHTLLSAHLLVVLPGFGLSVWGFLHNRAADWWRDRLLPWDTKEKKTASLQRRSNEPLEEGWV